MPNVVVYVRATAWRELELAHGDPAAWVRHTVAAALPKDSTPPRAAPIPDVPAIPRDATRATSSPEPRKSGKARTAPCEHRVGADAFCARCD